MKKYQVLVCLLPLFLLSACQIEEEEPEETSTEYVIQIGDVYMEMTEEIIAELNAANTYKGQLGILYENFESQLNRDDSYTGPDTLNNGIRDDIEAFIEAIQAEESIKNAMKQSARSAQSILTVDFTQDDTRATGYEMAEEYEKVLACYVYLGVDISDISNFESILESLTYNTENRMMRFMDYSKRMSGGTFSSLDAKEEYCE